MNDFTRNIKKQADKPKNTVIEESADRKRHSAKILQYIGYNLETGYFKATDEQWKMIDELIEQIYRKKRDPKEIDD